MESLPNFSIQNRGKLSFECLHRGLRDFHEAIQYIQNVPYGRISNEQSLERVMTEDRGTCSSKHAFLVELARENGETSLQLMLGVFMMSNANTEGINEVLDQFRIERVPEAHSFIRFNDQRYDFTLPEPAGESPFDTLVEEVQIKPHQIGDFKRAYHRDFMSRWLKTNKPRGRWNLEKLWTVREACIRRMSGIFDVVVLDD